LLSRNIVINENHIRFKKSKINQNRTHKLSPPCICLKIKKILKNIANFGPASISNKLSHPKTPKKDQKKGINKNKSHQQSFFCKKNHISFKNKTHKEIRKLGISSVTLRRWLKQGRITHFSRVDFPGCR
jgi:hypothetical protein